VSIMWRYFGALQQSTAHGKPSFWTTIVYIIGRPYEYFLHRIKCRPAIRRLLLMLQLQML